jgi:glyoxylase-like metal-dependent hydrolase (beta-lactamase superfamily II)
MLIENSPRAKLIKYLTGIIFYLMRRNNMRIRNGVAILELDIQGIRLNPTLLWDDEVAVLIDTGMPGQLEQIQQAMSEEGVPFEQLKAVIITHQDLDHIGSLPELTASLPNVEVYAHELDKPYIEGTLPLIKTNPSQMSKEQWDALPDPMKYLYQNPPTSIIHQTLQDGEYLPFAGGIQVIFTPGHAPGHISLYHTPSKTLVAGDAMVVSNGRLKGPIPQTTLDLETATKSLDKFLDFDIDHVICYHGGLFEIKEKKQLEEVASR